MNRVRLSAFAAALLLACPVIISAQEKTMTTSTGMELVWIPPGEFMMGSTAEERDWAASKGCAHGCCDREGDPRLTKITAGFWLGRTEVTVEQWRKFVSTSHFVTDAERAGKGYWQEPSADFKAKDNYPVCWISWNDAVAYCQWLTNTEKNANKLPSGYECRLPTEAEWEYACRAGKKKTKFWWGDDEKDGEGRLNWYGKGDGFEFLSPVDHFKARGRNRFGLADMLGNAWEWCLDDFDSDRGHADCYKGNPNARVRKGGSFGQFIGFERCAARMSSGPTFSQNHFGFRICSGLKPRIETTRAGASLAPDGGLSKTSSETKQSKIESAPVADQSAQKDAKQFARTQSSIKGLFIQTTAMGQRVGGAQDIIATVERAGSNLETTCDILAEAAKDTKISMEEAERLLKVRYPVWQSGRKVRFSYGDKYSKQAGGSAGGAFSVLLLSLLDGFQIDPGFAMTGDVTVDGKIRQIGAAAEKIRGAMLEKCSVVAIPVSNKENLNDLAILYSPAMFWSIQILSIGTLENAGAAARLDRDKYLANALSSFYQIQRGLGPNAPVAYLRNRDTYMALQQVLQLAPNHLSAEFMLRAANNQLPNTLSLSSSIEEIWAASALMHGYLLDDKAPDPAKNTRYRTTQLPAEAIKVALDRLTWLDTRLHPKAKDLKSAMYDYIQSLDNLRRQGGLSTTGYSHNLAKRDKVLGEFIKLGTDRNALEELMH